MKQVQKHYLSLALSLGGGAAGLALRFWLLRGRDADGLLPRWHPAGIALTALSALVLVLLFLLTREPKSACGKYYYVNFPASPLGGGCALLAAAVLFAQVLGSLIGKPGALGTVCDFLGLGTVFSLAFTGCCRIQRRRPNFLFHLIICLYFTVSLIARYRVWSANPQISQYACELLASVCLMLTAYHRAAFDLNQGSRSALRLLSLAGGYFSILCLCGTNRLFYAAMAAWLFTGLCVPALPEGEPDAPAETDG